MSKNVISLALSLALAVFAPVAASLEFSTERPANNAAISPLKTVPVLSAEQLVEGMAAYGFSQQSIDEALKQFTHLQSQQNLAVTVEFTPISLPSIANQALTVNSQASHTAQSFMDITGYSQLTSANYAEVVKKLSLLQPENTAANPMGQTANKPTTTQSNSRSVATGLKFQQTYLKLPAKWARDSAQYGLANTAFTQFIANFNLAMPQLVSPNQETYRQLLVASASLTKKAGIVATLVANISPDNKAAFKTQRGAKILDRRLTPNLSTQLFTLAALLNNPQGAALSVRYQSTLEGSHEEVYFYLPEPSLTELAGFFRLSGDQLLAIQNSSYQSLAVLAQRVRTHHRNLAIRASAKVAENELADVRQTRADIRQRTAVLDKDIAVLDKDIAATRQRTAVLDKDIVITKKLGKISDNVVILIKDLKHSSEQKDTAAVASIQDQLFALRKQVNGLYASSSQDNGTTNFYNTILTAIDFGLSL